MTMTIVGFNVTDITKFLLREKFFNSPESKKFNIENRLEIKDYTTLLRLAFINLKDNPLEILSAEQKLALQSPKEFDNYMEENNV